MKKSDLRYRADENCILFFPCTVKTTSGHCFGMVIGHYLYYEDGLGGWIEEKLTNDRYQEYMDRFLNTGVKYNQITKEERERDGNKN